MSRIFSIAFFVGIVLTALSSCNLAEKTKEQTSVTPFFDLKGYFQEEVDRLSEAQPTVSKSIEINDQEENKTIDQLNYEEELKIFLNSDINRSAWFDKYQIDSTLQGGNLQELVYKAKEKDLKTQEIHIQFDQEQVRKIEIHNLTETAIATSEQWLKYQPNSGYQIISQQKAILSQARNFTVNVTFKK